MASTITRDTWTDDTGTAEDPDQNGTLVGNDQLQDNIYDRIDQMFAGAGAYATFVFGGAVSMVSLVLSGALTAASITLSGAVNAATGVFSGLVTMGSLIAIGGATVGQLVSNSTVNAAGAIFELGRGTALGHWLVPTFNAADYDAESNSAFTVVTVASGNVASNRYTVIGKTLLWNLQLSGWNITGASISDDGYFRAKIPGGFTAAVTGFASQADGFSNGTRVEMRVQVVDGTHIGVFRVDGAAWPVSSGSNIINVSMFLQIS